MVYIPFPRTDLNAHPSLTKWFGKTSFAEGDWKDLRDYLAEHPRMAILPTHLHSQPKCWYTELPQGDKNAQDVEHFRPKNAAKPLTPNQITKVHKLSKISIPFQQSTVTGHYDWLEFEHRNYRFATALPNRGGGKADYFPIAANTTRIKNPAIPWAGVSNQEYLLLLDPVDQQDARLLLVFPDGSIGPSTHPTPITNADLNGLPGTWRNDGFNYLRALVSIVLYQLGDKNLIAGRHEVFETCKHKLTLLEMILSNNIPVHSRLVEAFIAEIFHMILPSAPFALAARCALMEYMPLNSLQPPIQALMKQIQQRILSELDKEIARVPVDWHLP